MLRKIKKNGGVHSPSRMGTKKPRGKGKPQKEESTGGKKVAKTLKDRGKHAKGI